MNKNAKQIIVLSTITCLSITGCENKVDKIDKCIDNYSFEEALSVLTEWENISTEDREQLISCMKENLTNIINNYAIELITYEQACQTISAISDMYLNELNSDIAITYAEVESINVSKKAYIDGIGALEKEDYLSAIMYFNNVIELDSNYDDAVIKIKDSFQAYSNYIISQAQELAENNEYEQAISVLNNSKIHFTDSTTIDEQINLLQDEYLNYIISQAQKLADDKNYEEAIELLNNSVEKFPSNKKIAEEIVIIQDEQADYLLTQAKTEAISEAEKYAQREEYADAIITLNEFKQNYTTDDIEINTMYNEYSEEYVSKMVTIAKDYINTEKYLKAIRFLNDCNKLVPSSEFDNLITQVNAIKPMYLCEVKCQNSELYEEITEGDIIIDTLGNEYNPGDLNLFEIDSWSDGWGSGGDGYADYYLGYQYKTLHGVIAVDDISDIEQECTFKIEGDGVTLYSLTLNRKTIPTPINIDVSGVNYLTIKVTDHIASGHVYGILSNFYFEK